MPIYKHYANEIIIKLQNDIESGLRYPNAFLGRLIDDNDWSFVIKVQTLIEGSITEALVSLIGDKRLSRLVERLPLIDEAIGKLSLAKDLDLLSKPQRRFIREIATLRNRLAHKSENIDFSFNEYFSKLTTKQQDEWKKSIIWFDVENDDVFWSEAAVIRPRIAIWVSTVMLVGLINISRVEADAKRIISDASLKTAEELYCKINTADC